MIWHFVEVWALLFVAFVFGCGLGAGLYGVLARSNLATAQGSVADSVGDVVDGIKARLGVGPVWRPEYRHLVERPLLGADEEPRTPLLRGPDQSAADGDADAARYEQEHVETAADQASEAVSTGASETPSDEASEPPAPQLGEVDDGPAPVRPVGLSAPRNGVPDNLQKIKGIGARNEKLLHSLGVYHFGQIAAWTPGEVRWIAAQLAFPERIERDDWLGQAMILASGGETGFTKASERRRERRRRRQKQQETADER